MKTTDRNSLAIIPARGGSKRLPGKNLAELCGKPLIGYTIEAAINSGCFNRILLSSDDDNILAIGEKYHEVTPEKRDDRLATDQATVLELTLEISRRSELSSEFDIISLLLPTCPFREAWHIRKGFDLLNRDVDGVVSLTKYDFPPKLSVSVDELNGLIKPVFSPSPLITGRTRTQDQESIYRPNGAFYLQWWQSFLENRNFFKGNIRGYVMTRLSSVDIDDATDLEYARFLLENNIVNLDL